MALENFQIPDAPDATVAPQARLFASDIAVLVAGYKRTGILSGGAVTQQASPNMTVAISACTYEINGRGCRYNGGSTTVGQLPAAALPRRALIELTSAGTIQVVLGTPAAITTTAGPRPPDPTIGNVVVAVIDIGASATTITAAMIKDHRVPLLPRNEYTLTSWGVTTASTATAITAAFNAAITWISAWAPGATLMVPNGTWTVNTPIFLRSQVTIRGKSKTGTIIFLAANAQCNVMELASGITEFFDISVENLTIDGNRYNQGITVLSVPAYNCIAFSSSAFRHDLKIVDVIAVRAGNYGVAMSGVGYMEDVWLIRVHVIDSGSDGFDSRGEWPYNRRQYSINCTVEGYGFRRGAGAAAMDWRGQWHVVNPYVVFKQRHDSSGPRFHASGGFDNHDQYGSMYSTCVGANVTAGGGDIIQALATAPLGTTFDFGNTASATIIRRPVPRIISFLDYTNGGSPASSTTTFPMPATTFPLPRPWRVQMLIVAARGQNGTPAVPTFTGAGLTWRSGDPLRPAIEGSIANPTNTRLSILYALPHFHITNAVDWSRDPADDWPSPPATPVTSGPPTAAAGTITFDIPVTYCMAMWVEWDDASILHGYQAHGFNPPQNFYDYGAHGADSMVQSVSNVEVVAPFEVTLNTFDVLAPGNTGMDRWGNVATNVAFMVAFNNSSNAGSLTPKDGYWLVGEKFSHATAGRTLTLMFRSDDGDPVPGGTIAPAPNGPVVMMGMEIRTGR